MTRVAEQNTWDVMIRCSDNINSFLAAEFAKGLEVAECPLGCASGLPVRGLGFELGTHTSIHPFSAHPRPIYPFTQKKVPTSAKLVHLTVTQ